MSSARILLVEDRASLRRMLVRALEDVGHEIVAAADGSEGMRRLEEGPFDLVLTDLKLPGATGLEVLACARKLHPAMPVVVMTAYGTVATAVEAMKKGALDFLEKPVEIDDLYEVVATAVGDHVQKDALSLPGGRQIVGSHPRLRAALRLAGKVAPTESTVLITGESGTGKELFARAIHELSSRSSGPFVAVNCAAIPETLLENELFGHEKGAYTGASRREAGRFEQASGGTLLLDEIGELGLAMQSKVLRVLEERTFERVGGGVTLEADVRLVGTTNRDLDEMVAGGDFRSDLYYRLNVFPIHLPSLADRASDIPELARCLIERASERSDLPVPVLTEAALGRLAQRPWPGNVRQLANVLERAAILAEGPRIGPAQLDALLDPLVGALEGESEEHQIRAALEHRDGDKKAAAEELGISYRTLQRRIKKYDLEGFPRHR